MGIHICAIGENAVVAFAADELGRYLRRCGADCEVSASDSFDSSPAGVLWVGESVDLPHVSMPKTAVARFDDAIVVDVCGGSGHIAGTNPRSVLLGVYRYLTVLGFAWVRPGADGEIAPDSSDVIQTPVRLAETPSCRHRGICIEGAVSLEHVIDIIDWAPKLGFNSYFIQFRDAFTFFERWYRHDGNPLVAAEPFTREDAQRCCEAVVREITRRGMIYHAVGHGWTCECLGIPGLTWEPQEHDLEPEQTRLLAEVGGERAVWQGIALNTNLCYSNPEAREMVVGDIVKHIEAHPEIDMLHFWLGDGMNNQCECAECRKARPSDFYVMMLNDLDRALTGRGLDTRIVFLIYVDLLWPPETQKIENPERFVLMFAPITRTYSKSFKASQPLPDVPPYSRNKLEFPASVEENLAFLRAWDRVFKGDGFDFDYHLWLAHYSDVAHTHMPGIIHADIGELRATGLDGLMSCQAQRAFFPTGLPMFVMGRTLWESDAELGAIEDDYFAKAFGPESDTAREYLREMGRVFDWDYMVSREPECPEAAARFGEAGSVAERFAKSIERAAAMENVCWSRSWTILREHSRLCVGLAGALRLRALGDMEGARRLWQPVCTLAWELEPALHPVLDVLGFTQVTGSYFGGTEE